jgi:Ca-activated chloride channel family protein
VNWPDITFVWPLMLLTLLLVPLAIVGYVLVQRRRVKYAARFTNLNLLANVVDRSPGWRRHLPPAFALAALAALLVCLARPQTTEAIARKRTTVVLAIDVSGSMAATDVSPTRLAAARDAAKTFLDQLPKSVRVGVVSFSTQAQVVTPATDNRDLVRTALDSLRPGGGTAIGDAIERSVAVGKAARGAAGAKRRPFSILLLSDGANSTGIAPLDGAAQAKQAKAPVYTIALGTPNGVVRRLDEFGNVRTIPVPPDPGTLRRVAAETGGRFFDAPSEDDLKAVYERLSSRVGFVQEKHEVSYAFAGTAAALLLAAGTLSALWFGRIP